MIQQALVLLLMLFAIAACSSATAEAPNPAQTAIAPVEAAAREQAQLVLLQAQSRLTTAQAEAERSQSPADKDFDPNGKPTSPRSPATNKPCKSKSLSSNSRMRSPKRNVKTSCTSGKPSNGRWNSTQSKRSSMPLLSKRPTQVESGMCAGWSKSVGK
ncbi:hypothetical protein VZH09_01435 [Synechococcus elongatus IITB7]|uniref:hypothetical protein n=1 Tax=Synechococcus elongatus TaxID=32046 RepID=UPI0030D29E2C